MTISLMQKLPDEVRRYRHDWSTFLGADTIVNDVEADTDAEGVTIDSVTLEAGSQSVVFKVSGGSSGTIATITHHIVTAAGDEETEIFRLPIGFEEPVSLGEAKSQCRVYHDDENGHFVRSISAARAYVENITGSVLVQREIIERRDDFGSYIELHRRPVIEDSVEISYIDADGVSQDYEDFVAQTAREPARLYPEAGGEWPALFDYGGVTVTYTAGYAAGEEPPELVQATLLLIGHWYDNREAVTVGDVSEELKLAVQSLCAQHWRPVI